VTANFAITADGRITAKSGKPGAFGSRRDQRRLLEIRSECDAILVGAQTLSADRMAMGLPAEDLIRKRLRRKQPMYPVRVVVTNSGKLKADLPVFSSPGGPLVVFSTRRMPVAVQKAIAPLAELYLFESSHVDLSVMLAILHDDYKISHLVCEGGGRLLRALLDDSLLDELHVTLCPRFFGGSLAPTLTGRAGEFLRSSVPLELLEMKVHEQECFTRWKVVR
jgi:riboflavin-specific deaminase-like protein